MDLLNAYDSDEDRKQAPLQLTQSSSSSITINAAPTVQLTTKDLPPDNDNTQLITESQNNKPRKNHLIGHVERVAYDSNAFDVQYTQSISSNTNTKRKHSSTIDGIKVKRDKSKTDVNDIDGYQGTWYVPKVEIHADEQKQPTATEPTQPTVQQRVYNESTVLHINNLYDYQQRSYLHTPTSIHIPAQPVRAYAPKQLLHTYTGHTAEVNKIKFISKSGHIFVSASNDCSLRIWSTVNKDVLTTQTSNKQCLRTIVGHTKGIRDIQLNSTHTHIATASYDKHVKVFDLETGQCIHRIYQQRTPNCITYNPLSDSELLIGMSDKRILQYDIRTDEVVQTYKEHMGAVNNVIFINDNTFISTGDDKRIYTWEYGIPVQIGALSDPDMHSIPCIALHPNKQQFVGQAQDNTIKVFNITNGKPKLNRKKQYKGHLSAGYACNLSISPDGEYVASGDAQGRLFIWEYQTARKHKQLQAHTQVCIDVQWHPIESSKLLSASWDSTIKYWD